MTRSNDWSRLFGPESLPGLFWRTRFARSSQEKTCESPQPPQPTQPPPFQRLIFARSRKIKILLAGPEMGWGQMQTAHQCIRHFIDQAIEIFLLVGGLLHVAQFLRRLKHRWISISMIYWVWFIHFIAVLIPKVVAMHCAKDQTENTTILYSRSIQSIFFSTHIHARLL